ncbi:TPA: hypothetical protein MD746_003707, partial [Klebsiella pneumoniae]|nr:hypothetical protein [Klebsiella pneumoniae]HDT2539352.1 hypothetical protein [Klebsiella aerogenes]HBT0296766.1 hypothetical protein [Klebsiella pneumoniae]HBU1911299.1 hypothetical protein [Klebsiella pneumoniae]HBU2416286.1 hypothetical protein [Klebsiella pneumoniae]
AVLQLLDAVLKQFR